MTIMKTLNQLFFLFCLSILSLAFVACNKDEVVTIEIENLPGCWKSQQREINGLTWLELTGFPPYRTLGIGDDGTYFLNYILGEWVVTDETLSLTYDGYGESRTDEYQILYLSSDSLVLESYLTEEDSFLDFPQFQDDEILTVVERFNR